jgi:hypothetical protein
MKEITLRSIVDVVKDPYKIVDVYTNYIQRKICDPAEYDRDNIVNTISDFLRIDEKDIDEYYKEALIIQEDIKNKTENLTGMGTIDVDGATLYILLRGIKANKIVETGVANGGSTYYILSAISKNGRGYLHSIDKPLNEETLQKDPLRKIGVHSKHHGAIPPGKDVGWLVPEQLRDNWICHLGDSKKILPKLLPTLSDIDVFIHDSRHMYRHMSFEYKVSWNYINQGGLLCSHDILQNNAFDDFVKEYNVRKCIKIGNFGGVYKI